MARTESKVTVNNFVGGLVSDFHELNSPPNTTIAEDNCDLDRKGSRKRRLGIDFEADAQPSNESWTEADWSGLYLRTFEWIAVGENGGVNFLVCQTGHTLTFYDMNSDTLSAGEKSFTIDLNNHLAPGYSNADPYAVSFASGKGVLFIVAECIIPFYISYNIDTDTITGRVLNLNIRDLQILDNELSNEAFPGPNITAQQQYDLYNMGWNTVASVVGGFTANVFFWYYTQEGKYPSKNKSWWVGKQVNVTSGVEEWSPQNWDNVYCGTSRAPLGHFIMSPFFLNRSEVSGRPDIPDVVYKDRPTSVAFTAGRVFYGWRNKIMFSQVLEDDLSVAENCYQVADPTAEDINDLVATDGGVIPILDASYIISLIPHENALFVFAANGVWALGGSNIGSGFSATDFSLFKVTDNGALSARSCFSVSGTPTWWSKEGIYALISDPGKQGYSAKNILEKKLQLYYNAIPPISKVRATGAYDALKKCIVWIYNSTGEIIGNNPYICDRVLNYDTVLEAFYPYTISSITDGNSPYIADVFNTLDIVATATEEDVLNIAGDTVIDIATDTVQVEVVSFGNSLNTTSSIKFMTFYLGE